MSHPDKPSSDAHLAQMLGVHRSTVARDAKRGMPVHSLAEAKAWRNDHLDPTRVRGGRVDYPLPRREVPAAAPADAVLPAHRVAAVNGLLLVGEAALAAGHSIGELVPALRAAMAAVPKSHRDDVALPLPVVQVLAKHVLDLLPPRDSNPVDSDGEPFFVDGSEMKDAEAEVMGRFWYSVCCGELLR